jgi:dTDP-4-dehydrorhamnose 3,5-epimerase-like enzyme
MKKDFKELYFDRIIPYKVTRGLHTQNRPHQGKWNSVIKKSCRKVALVWSIEVMNNGDKDE